MEEYYYKYKFTLKYTEKRPYFDKFSNKCLISFYLSEKQITKKLKMLFSMKKNNISMNRNYFTTLK